MRATVHALIAIGSASFGLPLSGEIFTADLLEPCAKNTHGVITLDRTGVVTAQANDAQEWQALREFGRELLTLALQRE